MSKPAFLASEVKLNFKLRDFFLDFMACIVPGLIFLVAASVIMGGLFLITADELLIRVKEILLKEIESRDKTTALAYLLNSFSFNFWFFLLVTFIAYFTGHLLYRQSPKRADYASFLRIRDRVLKKNAGAWVIEKGHGVKSSEVQFPYANLKNYLSERGFGYLARYVSWDNEAEKEPKSAKAAKAQGTVGNRSKTVINRAKIRLAFFFPDQMVNLIRNEAHIRLASSMWYAAKAVIKLSYICLPLILIDLSFEQYLRGAADTRMLLCCAFLLIACLIGKRCKLKAVRIMRGYAPPENPPKVGWWVRAGSRTAAFLACLWGIERERESESDKSGNAREAHARTAARQIDFRWKVHDHMPLAVWGLLFVIHYYGLFGTQQRDVLILYLGVVTFILIGALFSKRYIEESIHYQRVRELVYVLETAYMAKVLKNRKLPNPLKVERASYEVGLAVKDPAGRIGGWAQRRPAATPAIAEGGTKTTA